MDILEILRRAQGGDAVANLARTFAVTPAAAEAVLDSVVPQLSRRIERNTLSRGGVADMVGAIGRAADAGYLDDPNALSDPSVRQQGIGILDQILWSKDRSRAVAHRAAQSSGLSAAIVEQMLPVIAAMVMGGLAKGVGGGLGDILSRIPGLPGGGSGLPGGGLPQGGGPLSMPRGGAGTGWGDDTPGGNRGHGPLPMPGTGPAGGFGDQSPLPVPGNAPAPRGGYDTDGRNPLDDLSDVIRRGGQSVPGTGGGTLATIVRGILAAVLGFQNRGVLSWIIRYAVLRYGGSIVRWLLGAVLGRRA